MNRSVLLHCLQMMHYDVDLLSAPSITTFDIRLTITRITGMLTLLIRMLDEEAKQSGEPVDLLTGKDVYDAYRASWPPEDDNGVTWEDLDEQFQTVYEVIAGGIHTRYIAPLAQQTDGLQALVREYRDFVREVYAIWYDAYRDMDEAHALSERADALAERARTLLGEEKTPGEEKTQ